MKHTILTAVTCALMLSTCANDNQTFAITSFYPLVQCGRVKSTGTAELYQSNGLLDVAAGEAKYFVGATIESTTDSVPGCAAVEIPSGEEVVPACNNRPIVTEYVVTYTLSKRLGQRTPGPYVQAYTVALFVGAKSKITSNIQLISDEMAQALYDGLTPNDPSAASADNDFVDILAAVEFRGEFSATRAPFTTGTATFPIRAYRSTPSVTCPSPSRYTRYTTSGSADFCAYNGQDTFLRPPVVPFECCDPTSATPLKGC